MPFHRKRLLPWLALPVILVALLLFAYQKNVPLVEENVSYGTAEGEPLLLDVVRVPASAPEPAIVFIHGGAWRSGDKKDFRPLAEGFARRGYVSFSINYRLVNDSGHYFPAQLDDVQRAVRWVRANASRYGVDPKRIGALGSSAGGHLVSLLGTEDTRENQPPELSAYSSRVQCVADMFGPADLTANFPSQPADVPKLVRDFMDGTPAQQPQLYQLASPLFHIDHKTVPFLIFQGALDPLVPVEQSRRFAAALEKNGVPVTYVEFPDEGHGIEKPADREKFVNTTLQFFDSHLK